MRFVTRHNHKNFILFWISHKMSRVFRIKRKLEMLNALFYICFMMEYSCILFARLLFFLSFRHLHRTITIRTRVCLVRLKRNHKSFQAFDMQQITGNLPLGSNSTIFIIYPFCFSFKTN